MKYYSPDPTTSGSSESKPPHGVPQVASPATAGFDTSTGPVKTDAPESSKSKDKSSITKSSGKSGGKDTGKPKLTGW